MSYWCGKWGSAYQACDQQLFLVTGTSWRYEDVTDYLNLAGERYWYNTLAHSFTDALLVSQIHSRHTEHLTELNRRRAWTQLIFTHRYICYRDWRTGTSTLLCQPTRWASRRAVSQRHLKIASLRLQWRERRGGGGGRRQQANRRDVTSVSAARERNVVTLQGTEIAFLFRKPLSVLIKHVNSTSYTPPITWFQFPQYAGD